MKPYRTPPEPPVWRERWITAFWAWWEDPFGRKAARREQDRQEREAQARREAKIAQVVAFFLEQVDRVRTLDRVKNMREAINYLEAAICAEEPTRGAPFVRKPEERDRCLKEAMVHVSVAMRPEPAEGSA